MQSAELYSHPLRVLDVEARLGAPPALQTALWSAGSPRLRYFRADSGWQRSAASRQVSCASTARGHAAAPPPSANDLPSGAASSLRHRGDRRLRLPEMSNF